MNYDQEVYNTIKTQLKNLNLGQIAVIETALFTLILEKDDKKAETTFLLLREVGKIEDSPDLFTPETFLSYCDLIKKVAHNSNQTWSAEKMEAILFSVQTTPIEFDAALESIRTDFMFDSITSSFSNS